MPKLISAPPERAFTKGGFQAIIPGITLSDEDLPLLMAPPLFAPPEKPAGSDPEFSVESLAIDSKRPLSMIPVIIREERYSWSIPAKDGELSRAFENLKKSRENKSAELKNNGPGTRKAATAYDSMCAQIDDPHNLSSPLSCRRAA